MNHIKNDQKSLVLQILESASCGPQSADSVGGYAIVRGEASIPHVAFVMKQISDGRYITTGVGEMMLAALNTPCSVLSESKTQHIVANVL
ncbi:hypothetical protein NM449_17535 (plasmid) [Vibrio metschnikovii]|uniref:hypothetical protein n=1 Tax=Vibrio metschnikovii TaxID=28172 RepID=UPI002A660919|nr:hypothetical protein [Vibrio metschnikovii]